MAWEIEFSSRVFSELGSPNSISVPFSYTCWVFGTLTDSHDSSFEFDFRRSRLPLKCIGLWNSLPRGYFCQEAIAEGDMCKWSQHAIRQIYMALEEKSSISTVHWFLTAIAFLSHLTMWHRISSEPSPPQPQVQQSRPQRCIWLVKWKISCERSSLQKSSWKYCKQPKLLRRS